MCVCIEGKVYEWRLIYALHSFCLHAYVNVSWFVSLYKCSHTPVHFFANLRGKGLGLGRSADCLHSLSLILQWQVICLLLYYSSVIVQISPCSSYYNFVTEMLFFSLLIHMWSSYQYWMMNWHLRWDCLKFRHLK